MLYAGLALDDDAARAKIATALESYRWILLRRPAPAASQAEAEAVVTTLLDFVGYQSIVSTSPAYRQGDWLEHVVAAVILHLEASSRGAATWSEPSTFTKASRLSR